MTSLPKISIVTPSYNQGKFLEKTILSVLEQGYPNLEYIIIDGGSTDDSVEIVRKYADRLTYWVSEPDRGQSHAINKGFERATGEIFGWLNSDDWYHPGALQAVAEAFAAHPEAGAVVGAGEMVDEAGSVLFHNDAIDVTTDSLYLWHNHFFWQPSCFFTKGAWEQSGYLDENIHYALDLDLWFKIAAHHVFAKTDVVLSSSLKHEQAKTTAFDYLLAVDITFVAVKYGGSAVARKGLECYLSGLHDVIDDHLLAMQKMETMINERDAVMQKMETMINERDALVKNLEAMIDERDVVIESQRRELEMTLYLKLKRTFSEFMRGV